MSLQHTRAIDNVHKAAISLNNSGVNLIANGYPREGTATLKDAVHLLRMVSQVQAQSRSQLTIEEKGIMQAALHRTQCFTAATTTCTRGKDDHRSLVKPLWSQAIFNELVQNKNFSSNIHLPIVIEPRDYKLENTFDFDCAVMLYNYGLSMSVKAKYYCSKQVQAPLQENALRIYELAETILAKLDGQNCDQFTKLGEEKMILGVLLMQSIIKIYSELSRTPPVEYYETLNEILASIRLQYQLCPEANKFRSAPAA